MRDAKYDAARSKIAHAAFIPSRIWNDTSVWTASSETDRTLVIGGRFHDGRYRLAAAEIVPPPSRAAESRHAISLTRLPVNSYAWDTEVPYAIGSVTAAAVGQFFRAIIASSEGRHEREVRADYRATMPLTSATFGQLFRLDSIRAIHAADGSTLATFAVSMTPAGVEQRYPHFADYMRRYVSTARVHWTLTDRPGVSYMQGWIRDGHMRIRVRTHNGKMVSLLGAPRAMPDSLRLNADVSMKVRRFTVGFRDYHADFTIIATDRERAFSIVSREEPDWVLPLATERLLRTPLRRPFQGNGALFRIGVRDSAGAQTILNRHLHLEVQESAILRFIGRLGSIALSDFSGQSEREQLAWLQELFAALVADVGALGRHDDAENTNAADR